VSLVHHALAVTITISPVMGAKVLPPSAMTKLCCAGWLFETCDCCRAIAICAVAGLNTATVS
jgi:hypothetical protein